MKTQTQLISVLLGGRRIVAEKEGPKTYAEPEVHSVDGIELGLGVERIVELKGGLYRFWVVLLLLEKVEHLERLANVGNLFFETSTALGRVELHELVLGHGLLKLFQSRLDLFIWSTEVFLHIGLCVCLTTRRGIRRVSSWLYTTQSR